MRIEGVNASFGALGATDATSSIGSVGSLEAPAESRGAEGGVSFAHVIGDFVNQANLQTHEADKKAAALASGASDDLHGTMIAAKEAEISVKLVGTIRNKLLDAFHEIWRTSV